MRFSQTTPSGRNPRLVFGYSAFEPKTIRHEVQRLSRLLSTRVERRGRVRNR